MKRIIICLFYFLCFILFFACDSTDKEKNNELVPMVKFDPRYNLYIIENDTTYYSTRIDYNYDNVDYQICKGNEKFAIKELKNMVIGKDENCVFSPFGLSLTYSMMINGSSSNEEKEARDFLGIDEHISTTDNNYFYRKTIHEINKDTCANMDSQGNTSGLIPGSLSRDYIQFTNKIWIDKTVQIKRSFISSVNQYAMGVHGIDFVSEQSNINSEIANSSDNKNASIVIDSDNSIINSIVTNSIRFNKWWKYKYEKYDAEYFMNNGTKAIECKKFGFKGNAWVYDNIYYIVELPYWDSDYSMFVIYSPDQNVGYSNVLSDINDQGGLSAVVSKMKEMQVSFKMPSFTIDYSSPLGISDNEKCPKSFSNVSGNGFSLDKIYQVCSVKVDSRGTSAEVDYSTSLPPLYNPNTSQDNSPCIDVNSPFMFVIRNNKLATILFSGYVSKL